jgi:hypothetical protein
MLPNLKSGNNSRSNFKYLEDWYCCRLKKKQLGIEEGAV